MDLESHAYQVLGAVGQGLQNVLAKVYENISLMVIFRLIAYSFLFERVIAFAAPRTPVRLNPRLVLAVRGPILLVAGLYCSRMLNAASGAAPYPSSELWKPYLAIKIGTLVEYVLAIRERKDPLTCLYTYPELWCIFREAAAATTAETNGARIQPEMAAFVAVVLWSQMVYQFVGIYRLRKYHLYATAAVIVPYLAHFVWSLHDGILHHPALALFSVLRLGPLLAVILLNGLCYGCYAVVWALGGRDNMALDASKWTLVFHPGASFYHAWFILAAQTVSMSPSEAYMAELNPICVHQPYLTVEHQQPKDDGEKYSFNPIGEILAGFLLFRSIFKRSPAGPLHPFDRPDTEWVGSDSESEWEEAGEPEGNALEAPPMGETLEVCGQEILDLHMTHGRMTRSKYALVRSSEYLAEKRSQQKEYTPGRCVVCLDAAREIVLWPCGCLCLCQDCRGALGTQDHRNCICCRRPVTGYSRVFIP